MPPRNSLSDYEVSIIKKLLYQDQHSNQEIVGIINRSRGDASSDINSGRITNIKKNHIKKYASIAMASDQGVETFLRRLNGYDPQTGLNYYKDERLIRAREAMILGVQIFNSPSLRFKTEIFAVLANIAWTYLLHEFYTRQQKNIVDKNNKTIALSRMLDWDDCPLGDGMKRNLSDIKKIRDEVEHQLFGPTDGKWFALFQACCLNFDKILCEKFGERLSLQQDLSFALQFAKLDMEQITTIQDFDVPGNIKALDARLTEGRSETDLLDLEYRFQVVYTLDSAARNQSHIKFVHPESQHGQSIRNILVKHKTADELYPHKPNKVRKIVEERTEKKFTMHDHIQAWKTYKARPIKGASQPEKTNKEFCIYHAAHGDYTYSEKWVEMLIRKLRNNFA